MGTKILPLVSVFTCVYNMADKIERTFNSIRRQTYPNIEHIIVDDGSTDGVDALIMDYKNSARYTVKPVSYTHLDVYKRQGGRSMGSKYYRIGNGAGAPW